MKFDPSQVLATIDALPGPDYSESAAAGLATERLASNGLNIERWNVDPSSIVVARSPSESPPARRVLIQTPLSRAAPPSRLDGLLKGLRRSRTVDASTDAPTPADPSGFAMLVELARAWPRSWPRRVELVLIAGGGGMNPFAGAERIAHEFDPARSGIPTLMIFLAAPGAGRELVVVGERRESVLATAASLWIPTAPPRSAALGRRLWSAATARTFPDHVGIVGAGFESVETPALDPDALTRAYQLVAEIALRWAREGSDQPAAARPPRIAAKSSQNPG